MIAALSTGSRVKCKKVVLQEYSLCKLLCVSYAQVLFDIPRANQTEKSVRLVGYTVDDVTYWAATDDCCYLIREQVAGLKSPLQYIFF